MSQQTLVDDLKRHIASGHVVVVAGTGVSVATCDNQQVDGFPVATWTGLLKQGVHFCQHAENALNAREAKSLLGQIKVGETDFLIAAAERIAERLRGKRPGAFHRWLKDSVGKLAPTQPDIIQTLAGWPVKLATLNYDHLIEAVTSRQPITWQDRDKIEDVLRYGGDVVIHLHGHFDKPDSVILGLSSYAKVASDLHTQAVLQLFTLGRTLLFIGCGGTFQDPNFSRLIEWGREALKDSTARHFVLCQRGEKTKFVELQKTAPWLYPIVFGAKHDDLPSFLRSLAPAATPSHPHGPPPKPPPLHLAVYAKAVCDRYAKLKLESLDATGCYYRELALWRVFVPQHVRECQEYLPQILELPKEHLRRLREAGQIENGELDAERIQDLRRRYLDQTPRNALELMDDPTLPKVVILGDPGAGKSCLLQALTLHWAERPELERQHLDLPLLIELRAYAQARERDHINGFLDFWQQSPLAPCQLTSHGLRELLETGQVQVFFDGLDEVFDPALREEVVNVIQRFANDFPRIRIVVTSRVIGYKGESFRSAGFRHFMLQELDDQQIATFIDKWHSDTYRSIETAERDEKHARLIRAIANSRPIRELAGNPLLLTMMAILNRYRDLPRDRAELYEECSKLLLQQWKVEDALRADPDLVADALAIGLREKQDMLRRLARAMQTGTNGPLGNLIATDRLEAIVEEAVKSLVKGNPRTVARALIRHLRERNFILCFAGGDSYAFVHRTFLEYFCADDLRVRFEHEKSIDMECLKQQVFGPHWADETWHEVLCLVAGMIHPKALAGILEFLLTQPDPEQTCQPIFLAARCVGEVRRGADLGGIISTVKQKLTELTKFDFRYFYNNWDKEANKVSSIRLCALKLKASIWNTDPEMLIWLKKQAQSDEYPIVRKAAIQELVRGWKDDPETLSWLKSHVQSDENGSVRQAIVQALGHGWKGDSGILDWLKSCAQSDGDEDIRRAAVQELARGWKDDQETLIILKACIKASKNVTVRLAALSALAQGWRNDPNTLVILKDYAQPGRNILLRHAAMQELVRGWGNDPDVLSILKYCARSDQNDWMRHMALEMLAQDWRNDPETLVILKYCTQPDQDDWIKRTAISILAKDWRNDPGTLILIKTHAQSNESSLAQGVAVRELVQGWRNDPDTLSILKRFIQSNKNEWEQQIAIRALARGWRETPDTLAWLKTCIQSNEHCGIRQTAVQELARGWRDDLDTLSWLKDIIQFDDHWGVRQAAIQELVRGWRDDQDTLLITKTRAQSDKSASVRKVAIQELAHGWLNDSDILSIIKARAQSDKSATVRQTALQELVRSWPDESDTLVILKTHAQSDENVTVRQTAVRELARCQRNHPDTLLLLKNRAQFDQHDWVRQAAVQALAWGWKDDPNTLPILKARVQTDEDGNVRQVAIEALARGWKDDPDVVAFLKSLTPPGKT